MYTRPFKDKNGQVSEKALSKEEIYQALERSWPSFLKRTSFVECKDCGQVFLVNNQDFQLSARCPGCKETRSLHYMNKDK